MYRHVMDAIINEMNIGLCLRDIANHWACRCTVPGPGMRQAAQILRRRYKENGVAQARIIAYPADDRTEWLHGHRNPLEWQPHSAELAIVEPASHAGRICSYADEPLCLASNSAGTPPEGVRGRVAVRNGHLNVKDVRKGEYKGKLLLTDQFPWTVEAAARKGNALGIISDCISPPWLASYPPVREPDDTPDLVMWTCLSAKREQSPLFAFNLSARQGRRLRWLIEQSPKPVVLKAIVNAELLEGTSDFVYAVLPGTDLAEEEVWILAHLSEPGARDNASGCCLSLELARTLHTLTSSGRLPPLRRTIRFMHAMEVTGFLPYIDANLQRLPKVVAGLCLDSVGQDFSVCGGELVLYQSPETDPSFVDGLLEVLLNTAKAEPVARFSRDNYAIFPWHKDDFWGNDAFISDGFFDIPTPQLSAWPDRFYHSNQDTPDQMSDNTLGRIAAATGTYLYLLATAGAKEALWFAHLAAQDWKQRICRTVNDLVTASFAGNETDTKKRNPAVLIRHLGLQGYDAIMQASRFARGDSKLHNRLEELAGTLLGFARQESLALSNNHLLSLAEADFPDLEDSASFPESAIVPRRLRWEPPPMQSLSRSTQRSLALLRKSEPCVDTSRIWKWINGRRSAFDIWARLQREGPIALASVIRYIRLMVNEGMVELTADVCRTGDERGKKSQTNNCT